MCVRACVHVRACACVCAWDTPHTATPTPTPMHPSTIPPGGGSPESKNSITLELIKIFQFPFEDLKSVKNFPTHGWVCGLVGGWVVGWVDGWDQVKTLKNLKMLTESR